MSHWHPQAWHPQHWPEGHWVDEAAATAPVDQPGRRRRAIARVRIAGLARCRLESFHCDALGALRLDGRGAVATRGAACGSLGVQAFRGVAITRQRAVLPLDGEGYVANAGEWLVVVEADEDEDAMVVISR